MEARGISCLTWRWRLLLLALHALPFATRPGVIGGDEPHYALMTHSIAADGDLDLLDDYAEVAQGRAAAGRRFAGRELDPHLAAEPPHVFLHPLGLPLALAPGLALQQRIWPGSAPDLFLGLATLLITGLGAVSGWRLLAAWSGEERRSALVAIGLYFSSPLWFSSRTLFTESWSWPIAIFALAAFHRRAFLAGSLWLGALLALKETTALIAAPVLLHVLWQQRYEGLRRWLELTVGPALFAAFFVAKNLFQGLPALATFQPFQLGSLAEGAKGLALDFEHGLLPFAPLALLGLYGWVRSTSPVLRTALLVFALYFLVSAAWVDWRGGSCLGPRLLLPVVPALALPLVTLPLGAGGSRALTWAGAGLFMVGFTAHTCAALDPFDAFWGSSILTLLSEDLVRTAAGILLGAGLLWGLPRALAPATACA